MTTCLPAVGAFDVRLELLDAAGNPTGAAGSVATEGSSVVLDYLRWLLPVSLPTSQAAASGSFMESGHGAVPHLHGGVDIVPRGVPAAGVPPPPAVLPDLRAARSGRLNRLAGATNPIQLDHAGVDRTRYLHGNNIAAHNNGDLVLQGARLAQMSNAGTIGFHLHFEHRTEAGGTRIHNPRRIIALWDTFRPQVDAVYIRAAAAAGAAASLTNASTGIAAEADLIVRCRDRVHPGYVSLAQMGPYGLSVAEKPNPVAAWPEIRFDSFAPGDPLGDYFAQQGHVGIGLPNDAINHYLLYLRWDTAAYGQRGGHLSLQVTVTDFDGQTSPWAGLSIGPEAALVTPPPQPATSSANPQPFPLEIEVRNHTYAVNDNPANNTSFVSLDNFHIRLAGAPNGWTVAPVRTGPIGNGATAANPQGGEPPPQRVALTIDPRATPAGGAHAFEIVVYSDILRQVGARVPVTAVLS
jgi:hypothetical protein